MSAAGSAARPAPAVSPAPLTADLYSRRALRRAATLLRLRLLELRLERLDRVRGVIEHQLPIDELFCDS